MSAVFWAVVVLAAIVLYGINAIAGHLGRITLVLAKIHDNLDLAPWAVQDRADALHQAGIRYQAEREQKAKINS